MPWFCHGRLSSCDEVYDAVADDPDPTGSDRGDNQRIHPKTQANDKSYSSPAQREFTRGGTSVPALRQAECREEQEEHQHECLDVATKGAKFDDGIVKRQNRREERCQ